jgi:ankyrin repeat protein
MSQMSSVYRIVSDFFPLQLYTPLHAAAAGGSVDVAQILVESGAEVDARNSYGNTPLHIACLNGHSSLCSELTYCGADINALNYRGQVIDKSLYCTRPVFTVATVWI